MKRKLVIEKIDIRGAFHDHRAAAKNFKDLAGGCGQEIIKHWRTCLPVSKAKPPLSKESSLQHVPFEIVAHYDVAIAKYFQSVQSLVFPGIGEQSGCRCAMVKIHTSQPFLWRPGNALFMQLNGKHFPITTWLM